MKQLSNSVFANLESVLKKATPKNVADGMQWYRRVNGHSRDIARKYGILVEHSAGVIAAISPGLQWDLNISQAIEFISAWHRNEELPQVGVYGTRNTAKALAVLEGADFLKTCTPSAKKTRSFYLNIIDPEDPFTVTIDRHAKGAAINETGENIVRPSEYDWLAEHYRVMARNYDILPSQLQAIIWETWRETK